MSRGKLIRLRNAIVEGRRKHLEHGTPMGMPRNCTIAEYVEAAKSLGLGVHWGPVSC